MHTVLLVAAAVLLQAASRGDRPTLAAPLRDLVDEVATGVALLPD
ncbi:hypothetical protein [Streptomyces sp. NPDC004266]